MPLAKVPIYKTILSFIWPIRLERKSSAKNRVLDVELYYGKIMLNTKQANYSFGRLHQIMTRLMRTLRSQNASFQRVLLLGYGGGSAAQIVHSIAQTATIVAVEHDEVVISLARKWFYSQNVEIVQADAIAFVKNAQMEKFDLIICDIFNDIYVPDAVLTGEFYAHCKNLLKENGHFAHNVMLDKSKIKAQFDLFASVFKDARQFTMFHLNTVFHGLS